MPRKADVNRLADAVNTALDEFGKEGTRAGSLILVNNENDDDDMTAEVRAVIFMKTSHAAAQECISTVNSILDRDGKDTPVPPKQHMH
jgi:hypothetical protein